MIQIPLSWWMSLNSKVDWYHPILCPMICIKWMSEQGGTFMQMIGGVASEKCSSSQLVDLMMNEVWFGVHRLKSCVSKPNPRQEATFLAGLGWKYPFHLRPLAYGEIVIFTTTSGSLPKNPLFFASTCDPRSHDQKSPIFVSGRMGTSAQKMYPTPLVKVVMVMLRAN